MLRLFILLLCVSACRATQEMALRAELELAKPCYTRFAPALWNTLMDVLPPDAYDNVDRIAKAVSMLREALGKSIKPCQAIRRALQAIDTRRDMDRAYLDNAVRLCEEQLGDANVVVMRTSPLLTCLGAGHRTGRAAVLRTREEEQAQAAKWRATGYSNDASMTYGGTYASAFTQTVVDHVKILAEEEAQGKSI